MALLHRLRFRLSMLQAALTVRPIAGGEDPPEDDPKPDPPKDDPKPDPKADDPDDDKVVPDDDWQAKARKHERRAKKLAKEAETAQAELEKLKAGSQSEQEKAIAEAAKKARDEALSEASKERKADRLEVAVTRLASKGITVGSGDEAKTLKFADSEQALVFIERAIAKGEVDESDVFDDAGQVQSEALGEELANLLKRHPNLAAGDERPSPGDPDTRKGDPDQKDLESMTPEDHAKRKYAATK